MIYPLCYSIPLNKFQEFKEKEREWSVIDPRDRKTYIYKNEKDYYDGYNISKFAITKKKGGWDCLRHYEIIASGCLPIFLNIEKCPPNTLDLNLKIMLQHIKNNYLTYTEEDYIAKRKDLFDYTKENLNCDTQALRFLKKYQPQPKRVLMLNGAKRINYTRELLSIGLRNVLGDGFVDYPKNEPLYKDPGATHKLYGKGFTYSHHFKEDNIDRTDIKNKIKNGYFDLIIYGLMGCNEGKVGDVRKSAPMWDLVAKHYSKIVFLYGGDKNQNPEHCEYHSTLGDCFVRELV